MRHARPVSARLRTAQLSLALAGAAVAIVVVRPTPATLVTGANSWLLAVGLGLAFLLGEQFLLNIEFRRQAHSLTLSGIPVVLAALLLPLPFAVGARFMGSAVALGAQRMRPERMLFNLSMYGFEVAADTALIHAIAGRPETPSLHLAVLTLAVVSVVDQLMNCVVLVVIRLHNGPLARAEVMEVLLPALVLTGVSTSAAFGIVLLARYGVVGWVVIVVVAVSAVIMYRGFLITSRRHHKLETVHEFVARSTASASLVAAAEDLLGQIRGLLHATSVEMTIVERDPDRSAGSAPAGSGSIGIGSAAATRYVSDENGFGVHPVERNKLDWAAVRAVADRESLLVPRTTRDRSLRKWLIERAYRDAMITPLPDTSGLVGTITVVDRLGDTATFNADDLTLLQTLTSHFAVAGERAQMVEQLAYDATHDTLTGLSNRSCLNRRVLETPVGRSTGVAVLLLDLDEFKEVNDSLGHGAGDQLLRVVAERLRATAPAGSTVARLGGDEFAVCLSLHGDDGGVTDDAAALEIARQLVRALAEPVVIDEALLGADASIGVATTRDASQRKDLLRHADTAMYAAKRRDGSDDRADRVALYDPQMERARVESLALLADLRTTLQEHPERIAVYFQPKIDLETRTVNSAEALVRWHHPDLGVVQPDRFIPLAETAGLINQFTPLILDAALRECRVWADHGWPIDVAVNLSARNVGDPHLPTLIAAALRRAGVPSSSLVIEITESSVLAEPAQTLNVLTQLGALGVRVSLDDFGTGYSNLSYLQRLPVQEVKIDRSFVAGLAGNSRSSRALISAITSLCHNLDLHVVAEGAESVDALDELQELGCHVAQGYVIGRPMTCTDFLTWLSESAYAGGHPLRLVQGGRVPA